MITQLIRKRWTPLALALVLPACDVLDVNNPNNLTQDNIEARSAATALVNGALAANARAISRVWLSYLIATDEIVWIGSRDAWGQLDQGFVGNAANEFTDGAFPDLTQARWLSDLAATTLDGHVANTPPTASAAARNAIKTDQARAYLMAGLIYTIIGEVQEDFVFGDRMEGEEAVGAAQMSTVLDQAIAKLDKALTVATEVNNADLITRALVMRARAKHSRALWDKLKPTVNTAQPLVNSAGANADASAALARVADNYRYQLTYSASTLSNFMASEINSRGEQQFDTTSIISVNRAAPKTILGVKLQDPVGAAPDARILTFLREWKDNTNIGVAGTIYAPLTLTSAKHMHLILAESDLASGNLVGFTTHINAVRAVDGMPLYTGQIPAIDMLKHERRAALFLTGVRLFDMYRFGVRDPLWHATSDVVMRPGSLFPITCIEVNANPFLVGTDPDC